MWMNGNASPFSRLKTTCRPTGCANSGKSVSGTTLSASRLLSALSDSRECPITSRVSGKSVFRSVLLPANGTTAFWRSRVKALDRSPTPSAPKSRKRGTILFWKIRKHSPGFYRLTDHPFSLSTPCPIRTLGAFTISPPMAGGDVSEVTCPVSGSVVARTAEETVAE